MLKYIKSELLKSKRTFSRVLLWLAPLITILLAIVLMGGNNLQNGAYNWWYTIILPASFTMHCAFTATKESKKNRHGLYAIAAKRSRLWFAQILVCTAFLLITCMFFFLFITIAGILFGEKFTVFESFIASIVLFITFAWQSPLWLIIAEKAGIFSTIIINLICNFAIAVICATKSFWWVPFAIPSRLMCVCIRVLPNGLNVEAGSSLANSGVIFWGILITVALFIILTGITAIKIERQ